MYNICQLKTFEKGGGVSTTASTVDCERV